MPQFNAYKLSDYAGGFASDGLFTATPVTDNLIGGYTALTCTVDFSVPYIKDGQCLLTTDESIDKYIFPFNEGTPVYGTTTPNRLTHLVGYDKDTNPVVITVLSIIGSNSMVVKANKNTSVSLTANPMLPVNVNTTPVTALQLSVNTTQNFYYAFPENRSIVTPCLAGTPFTLVNPDTEGPFLFWSSDFTETNLTCQYTTQQPNFAVSGLLISADPASPPTPVFGNTYKFANAGGLGANFNVYLTVAENGTWNEQGWFEDTDHLLRGTVTFEVSSNSIYNLFIPAKQFCHQPLLTSSSYTAIINAIGDDGVTGFIDSNSTLTLPATLGGFNASVIHSIIDASAAPAPLYLEQFTAINANIIFGPNTPTVPAGTVTDTTSTVTVQINCAGLATIDLTEFASYAGVFDLVGAILNISQINGLTSGRFYTFKSSDNSARLESGGNIRLTTFLASPVDLTAVPNSFAQAQAVGTDVVIYSGFIG